MNDGRRASDAIVERALLRVGSASDAMDGGPGPEWCRSAAQDVRDLLRSLGARRPGLLVLRLLRECVAEAHGLAIEHGLPWRQAARDAHHLMDMAVSVRGGVADLIDDDLDWGPPSPEERGEVPADVPLALDALIPLARDIADLLASSGPSTAGADVAQALDLVVGVRAVLRGEGPHPLTLLEQALRESSEAFRRVELTLSGMGLPTDATSLAELIARSLEAGAEATVAPSAPRLG